MASSTTKTRRQRQVAAETRLKFRPAEAKLAQQLRDAAASLEQGEATARSVAETVRQAARSAIPQVQQAGADATTLAGKLREVGPAIDPTSPYGKARAIDREGSDARTAAMTARTITDLVQQQNRATAGEAFQVQNVRNQYVAAKDRIGAAQADVAAQKGDYEAQRLGEFAEADRKIAHENAKQTRSQRFTASQQEDRQAASREAARERERNKDSKPKKGPEGKLQAKFVTAVSKLAVSTYEVPDPKDPKKVIDKPVDAAYVKANRATVEAGIRAGNPGMSAEMARRVVAAFLKVGKKDPGSFKTYRPTRKAGGGVQTGRANIPKNAFG